MKKRLTTEDKVLIEILLEHSLDSLVAGTPLYEDTKKTYYFSDGVALSLQEPDYERLKKILKT